MDAREFYDKRLNEDPSIGSVQLMEEFAKHIIEINFCDGTPSCIEDMTVSQLKNTIKHINMCVDWVNT